MSSRHPTFDGGQHQRGPWRGHPSEAPIHPGRTRPHLRHDQKRKTEMCRNIAEFGSCKYGENCKFAHCETELVKRATNCRFKTELCYLYHEEGLCEFKGDRCSFIHQEQEVLSTHQRIIIMADCYNNLIGLRQQLYPDKEYAKAQEIPEWRWLMENASKQKGVENQRKLLEAKNLYKWHMADGFRKVKIEKGDLRQMDPLFYPLLSTEAPKIPKPPSVLRDKLVVPCDYDPQKPHEGLEKSENTPHNDSGVSSDDSVCVVDDTEHEVPKHQE